MSLKLRTKDGTETMSYDAFEERVRLGEIGPEVEVCFAEVTGENFTPAGELELWKELANPEHRRFQTRLRYGAPLATALLLGLQLRVFFLAKLPGGEDLAIDHFTNWAPAVLESGEIWRLLSYGWLHLGVNHLALNLLFLVYAGWNLERAMGRADLLTVFAVSVLTGGLLSMGLSPARPSLGASGGDFGLIAASVVFGWKYEDQLPTFARKYFGWAVLPYLVYPLCLGLLSSSVDNWGHLGGMLGGGVAATWLKPGGFAANEGHNRRLRRGLLAAGLGAMVCVWLWGPRLVQVLPYRAQGLETAIPQSWEEGWDFGDDRGWVSPTGQATWVATTQQLAAPPTPEEALQRFQQQLESRGSAVHVAARKELRVQGWPALRSTLTYRRGGVLQQMELLLVCRGATVHRMHLHFEEGSRFRYTQLAERLFSTISLVDPPLLLDARSRVIANPNSWKLAVELGRQAALTGHPLEAAEALSKAYQMPRSDKARVAALRLDLYGDYGLGLDPSHISLFLQKHGDEPQVVVATAHALERSGDPEGALAILEDAAQQSPDDLLIQRALAKRTPQD